jgi:hypothetical protein
MTEFMNWRFPVIRPQEGGYAEYANSIGVRFMHLRGWKTSCTVAYRPLQNDPHSQVLEIAVTYKHSKDQYNRKVGSTIAAKRFLEGNTITMPIRGKTNHETLLNIRQVFLESVEDIKNWM